MLLSEGFVSSGEQTIDVDVSNLSSGVYNVVYVIDGKLISKSTIINVSK
jgi:hypothetical protein